MTDSQEAPPEAPPPSPAAAATDPEGAPDGQRAATAATYYAVLVGIDDYVAVPKLSGCVSDVEAIEELLTACVQGPLVVRKLVARKTAQPGQAAQAELAGDDELPTRAAIVAVLSALSGDGLHPGDRVLFYYSGHGTQIYDPTAEDTRQGLVPQDFRAGAGLLFDIELRALLDRIYARTGDLTVVLDCCHSAGITRSEAGAEPGQARCIELRELDAAALGSPDPALIGASVASPSSASLDEGIAYPFLLACQADEKAKERPFSDPPQGHHGVLTHALIRTLSQQSRDLLAALSWADIWWSLRAEIISHSTQQHPQLLGPREQRVLGGPFARRAAGLPLRLLPDGRYELGIGTLAGLRPGARLAVYASAPEELPALGSAAERLLPRSGELVVVDAALATATAIADPPGAPIAIPAGACARVIQPAAADALSVTLSSELPAEVAQALRATAAEDHVRYVDHGGEARIGTGPDGAIWLGDDIYGPGAPLEPGAPGPLAYIPPVADGKARLAAVRAAILHYRSYVIPLRMARQGGFTIDPGRVQLQLLPCADADALRELRGDAARRHPLARNQRGIVQLAAGARFALAVRNLLPTPLYVTLLSCGVSGKVTILASGEFVAGKCTTVLGRSNESGEYGPLTARLPGGHFWLIDRIIIVAASQPLLDLYALRVSCSFAEAVTEALRTGAASAKDLDDVQSLDYTAACVPVQVGSPPGQ